MAKGGSIQPRIELTGEKEFRNAVSAITKEMTVLSSAMGKTSVEFAGQSESMEALTARGEQLQQQYDLQAKKVDTMREALENATKKFGEGSVQAQNWQISLNKAEGQLIKMGRALEENAQKAEELQKETKKSESLIGKAKSGYATLKGELGKLADATEGARQKFAAFADGVGKVAGAAVKAAASLGTAAVTGIVAAAENTREYRTELALLATNAEATGNSVDGMEAKLREVSTITGDSGAAVEGLSNIMQTGFSQSAVDKITDTLVGASIKWKDTLKFEGLADGLQETLATGAATGSFGEMLERMGMDLEEFNAGLQACNDTASQQEYILRRLSGTGLAGLKDAYEESNSSILAAERAQYDLNDALANLGAAAEPVIASVKGGLAEMLTAITEGFSEGNLSGISEGIGKALDMAIGYINEYLPQIMKMGTEILQNLLNGIIDNQDALIDGIINTMVMLIDGITDMLPDIIVAGVTILLKLAEGIVKAIPKLVAKIPQIIQSIVDGFRDAWPTIRNIGKNIVEGLWDGIKSMGSWLSDRFGDWVDSVVEDVKDFLGIHSPSTVFAGIGKYMAMGLGEGFENEMRSVRRQIDGAIPTELSMPGVSQYGGQRGGVTVIQYNTYQSPKALSPAESARQTRLATQRAALALQGG